MILLFPQNRLEAVLATMEEALTERLSGLLVLSESVSGRLPRPGAIAGLLDARRAYLLEAAAHKYGDWREAISPYAETGGEYMAILAEALGRLTENTQQTGLRAARRVQTLALAVLVTLGALIGSYPRKAKRRPDSPERRVSAAQCFALARRAAPLRCWRWQSLCVWIAARSAYRRHVLPPPRSQFPVLAIP